jgi:general secretion pathway protein L
MAETLIIRLGSDATQASWLAMDANGSRAGSVAHGSLELAAADAAQRRVLVLVPADEVLVTRVDLPVKGAARMRQALPFALEEQVAEDLELLHFAAGRRDEDGRLAAAATRRDRLQSWIRLLEVSGIEPSAIMAEQSMLPSSPTATVWVIEDNTCFIRRPDESPLRIEGDTVGEFMVFGDPRDTKIEGGAHLTVYLNAADQPRYAADLEALRETLTSVEIKLLPDGTLPLLATAAVRTSAVNLLQGDFAPRTGMHRLLMPWRTAAALLLALIALLVIRQGAELFQLKAQEQQLDESIQTVFREAMPDVTRVVNARGQLETRLRAIRGSGGESDAPFLAILEVVSRAVVSEPQTRIESLSFRNGVMELKLAAPGVDALDRVQRQVEASGSLEADILSANPRGEEVEGRIQISETGA